jgi:hypothetical protein
MRARLITQEAPKFSFFVTPTKVLAFAKGIFGHTVHRFDDH